MGDQSILSKAGGVLKTGALSTVSGIKNFAKATAARAGTSNKGKDKSEIDKDNDKSISSKLGSHFGRFLKGGAKWAKRSGATLAAGAQGFAKAASDHNAKTGRDKDGNYKEDLKSDT